jgi:hypothetical protein
MARGFVASVTTCKCDTSVVRRLVAVLGIVVLAGCSSDKSAAPSTVRDKLLCERFATAMEAFVAWDRGPFPKAAFQTAINQAQSTSDRKLYAGIVNASREMIGQKAVVAGPSLGYALARCKELGRPVRLP